MSLTTWLRDYLYIPLGGNRGSRAQTCRNILIILLCCGIWHGAAWNFLFWGLYNGLGLIAELLLLPKGASIQNRALAWMHRLLALLFILVGWVFFRCEAMADALQYIKIMFCGNPDYPFFSLTGAWFTCITYSNALFFILALVFSQPIRHVSLEHVCASVPARAAVILLFAVAYAFAATSNYSPFLYFRF